MIFGHTHNPGIVPINSRRARYINIGNWFGQSYDVAINDSDVELTRGRRQSGSTDDDERDGHIVDDVRR